MKFITGNETSNKNICDPDIFQVCKVPRHLTYVYLYVLYRPVSHRVVFVCLPGLSSVPFSTSEGLNFIKFSSLTDFDSNSALCNLGSTKPALTSFQERPPPSPCSRIQFNAQYTWDLSRTKLRRNKTLISLLSTILVIHFRRYCKQKKNYRQTFHKQAARKILYACSVQNSKHPLLQSFITNWCTREML
jgi:hypothetical protein